MRLPDGHLVRIELTTTGKTHRTLKNFESKTTAQELLLIRKCAFSDQNYHFQSKNVNFMFEIDPFPSKNYYFEPGNDIFRPKTAVFDLKMTAL